MCSSDLFAVPAELFRFRRRFVLFGGNRAQTLRTLGIFMLGGVLEVSTQVDLGFTELR